MLRQTAQAIAVTLKSQNLLSLEQMDTPAAMNNAMSLRSVVWASDATKTSAMIAFPSPQLVKIATLALSRELAKRMLVF